MTPSVIVSSVTPSARGSAGRNVRRVASVATSPSVPALLPLSSPLVQAPASRSPATAMVRCLRMNGPPEASAAPDYITLFSSRAMPDSSPWTCPTGCSSTTSSPRSGPRTGPPRLSWWLPDGATRQEAFRLQTAAWDSGRVEGTGHELVPYEGPPTSSRQRVEWRVKVWTDLGESDWSDWSSWEVGLADAGDWSARWIGPHEPERPPAGERPAHQLRHAFTLDGARRAGPRCYATAHGLYELFLNGARVGDLELTPGTTAYRSQLDVQTYDVTDLLVPGDNVLGAVLSDGWWRGKNGFTREADCFGTELALLAQLEVELEDGARVTHGTGPGWTTATGEIIRADLIDGESVDLHRQHDGWDRAGFDDGAWAEAPVVDGSFEVLTTSPAPPVRRVEELRPVTVERLAVGPPRRRPRPEHQRVGPPGGPRPGRHRLDPRPRRAARRVGRGDDRPPPAVRLRHREPLPAGQVDAVVSAGRCRGPVRAPPHHPRVPVRRHRGPPGPLGVDDVTGVVVHTDLVRTGWFSCSDDRLNRLHEAAVWSFRDNACDVPTDCPQRERAGWTGDWQLFCPTAAFLYDVAGFSAKWLRDLRVGPVAGRTGAEHPP